MKTNAEKSVVSHKINKTKFDLVCANNKTHHINNISAQQKKTSSKKRYFFIE